MDEIDNILDTHENTECDNELSDGDDIVEEKPIEEKPKPKSIEKPKKQRTEAQEIAWKKCL